LQIKTKHYIKQFNRTVVLSLKFKLLLIFVNQEIIIYIAELGEMFFDEHLNIFPFQQNQKSNNYEFYTKT